MSKNKAEVGNRIDTLRPAEPEDPRMLAARRLPDTTIQAAILSGREELAKLETNPLQDPASASAWLQFFA